MIGLKRGTLSLSPHNPFWKEKFRLEAKRISTSLGVMMLQINHIGSTAIRGISAKPIIDIAIEIRRFEDGFDCVAPLEALGYLHKGENGIPGRHYFRTDDEIVRFHIHMFAQGDHRLIDHILFRDYLNAFPDEAKRYEALKLNLLASYPHDRGAYTEGKSDLIQELLVKAQRMNRKDLEEN